jgi:hypothetical protein
MKQLLNCLSLLLLGSAVVAAGCSSSSTTTRSDGGGVGGAAGGLGGALGTLVPLIPDSGGWVDATTTLTTMIQGAWYGYGDMTGPDGTSATGDCEKAGHAITDCSMITMPVNGSFPQTTPGVMCTSGTAAKVPGGAAGPTQADYSAVWGAGIAMDLNATGGDAGTKMPYNATANHVIGFAFDIDVAPPLTGMRVEFPTPATASGAAYWNGGDATMANSPVKKGHNEFLFTKVGGPSYLAAPPAFDPTMINSIQFHIPTNATAAVPYMFCLSNMAAITQ